MRRALPWLSMICLLQNTEDSGLTLLQLLPLLALIAVWILVWLWIRSFLARSLAALPATSRGLRPWTSWFLLIPVINVVWNFHFLISLSQAYREAFADLGRELPVRESGRTEGIIYSVAFAIGWYPMASMLVGLVWMAGLMALTIYLFKIHSLAERFARIRED